MTLDEIHEGLRAARRDGDMVRAIGYLDEVRQHTGPQAEIIIGFLEGLQALREGAYDAAAVAVLQSLEIATECDDQEAIGSNENLLGLIYSNQGDFSAALARYYHALAIREQQEDHSGAAVTMRNIGWVSFSMGDHPQAMEYLRRALAVHTELNERRRMAEDMSTLAGVLASIGQRDEGIALYEQAIAIQREEENEEGLASILGNLGVMAERDGDYERALAIYFESLEIMKRSADASSIIRGHGNIALVLCSMERWDEAASHLHTLEETGPIEPADEISMHQIRSRLAVARGELDQAKGDLMKALSVAQAHRLRSYEAEVYLDLRDLAKKHMDFEAYVSFNELHSKLINEIEGKEISLKIAKHEMERQVEAERQESERQRVLLYGALPKSVADRRLAGEDVSGDHFDEVSVLFLDIVGFTAISDRIPPGHVVHLLKAIFRVCDEACKQHGLTKIKTIGDSYLAVAGVPEPLDDHADRAAKAALEMMKGLNELELTMDPSLGDTSWTQDVGEIQVRIGLHCGPVVAGIVGDERLQYDVWGDTVNTASRMESSGEPGKIQVSEAFASALGSGSQTLSERGTIDIKGKGSMTTYWLVA